MISRAYLDKLANQAATSPRNNLNEPTEQQIKNGNYKKGHFNLHGFSISIENPKDSVRKGTDPNGNKWSIKMKNHYGYINQTQGRDKDHLDIFIGPKADSEKVYIVNQKNSEGKFDEHKILMGWDSFLDAVKGYLNNYQDGWDMISSVHQTDVDGLKNWIKDGNTKIPFNGIV